MDLHNVLSMAALGFVAWRISQMVLGKTSPTKARELVRDGARLLDVRSPGEFGAGHLPGALNIPVQALAGRLGELGEKSQPVVLYCASGMRSASAASMLRREGFTQVFDLGAMSRWPG